MLFNDAVAAYMEAKRKRLRANTIAGYESAIRCHLLPRWGWLRLEDIRREDVQAWVDGMSYGSAAKAYKTLRQVLRWSIRTYRLRVFCETDGVELPAAPMRRDCVLTPKQLRRCTIDWRGEPWECVALVQSSCGLRPCEAAALTWRDIDLRTGEVHVERGRHDVGRDTYTWGTKTAKSRRTVVLPVYALARLREIKRETRQRRDTLLCALRPSSIYARMRRWFHARELDMCSERLRHTFATIAVSSGVPIETVAMELGHTSIETCYAHYVARSVDVFRRAAKSYAAAIMGT